jgi:hypothetical protein
VAPEGYVGLGMIATTTETAPPLSSLQTVPVDWTVVTR